MKKKMCDREKGVHYNHKSTLRCKCGFFVKLYVQKRIDYIDKELISFVEDLKEMRKEIKLNKTLWKGKN